MGTVFKKTTTRPIPNGAEIVTKKGERLARWRVRGKLRTAPVIRGEDGSERIANESTTYFAKYRDGEGVSAASRGSAQDRRTHPLAFAA